MARWDKAHWTPVDFHDKLEDRDPHHVNAVNFHTNGGGADLKPWFDEEYVKTHQRIGSHFQILKDGMAVQLADTAKIIYAAYQLSVRAIEVETEDDGNPSTPWTPAQMATFNELLKWAKEAHPGIQFRLMADANDAGISYHQQFAIYNQSGHNCPGPIRVNQLVHSVIPSLTARPAPHPPVGHVPMPVHGLPLPWLRADADTATWQRQMLHRGWRSLGSADGIYGPKSKAVCIEFQRQKHLHDTGNVDAATWRAAWLTPITKG